VSTISSIVSSTDFPRSLSKVSKLVVGAGPAGLVPAISLARAGIRCLVLNKRTRPAEHPRATVISLRSMELFRSWGLADAITAGGHEVEWLMLVTTTMSEAAAGVPVQVGYPSVAESALLSPTRPACVPQDHLEAVLTAHLKELPAARMVTGIDVEDISQEPDGHHLQLHRVQRISHVRPRPISDRSRRFAQHRARTTGPHSVRHRRASRRVFRAAARPAVGRGGRLALGDLRDGAVRAGHLLTCRTPRPVGVRFQLGAASR